MPARPQARLRIVTLGGDLTEIAFALGRGTDLVGRDTTSTYPEAALALPDAGYVRTLGAEGILSLRPDLVIASVDAGPPAAIAQIEAAGVEVLVAPAGYSLAGLTARLDAIGRRLREVDRATALADAIALRMAGIDRALADVGERPRVLFLLNAGDGAPLAAGSHTAADAMIALVRAENVFAAQAGYRPLSLEAAVATAPQAILTMDHALAAMGGKEGLMRHAALRLTPAAREGRIIARDGLYLLGFGPRLADARADLASTLHEGLSL